MYVACREFEIPRTLREIALANNEKYRETARAFRDIILYLGKQVQQIDLFRYIEKVGKKAKLEEKNIREALSLLKKSTRGGTKCRQRPNGNSWSCYLPIST